MRIRPKKGRVSFQVELMENVSHQPGQALFFLIANNLPGLGGMDILIAEVARLISRLKMAKAWDVGWSFVGESSAERQKGSKREHEAPQLVFDDYSIGNGWALQC